MTDWVPGTEDQLGWGINIFGSYFQNAKQSSKLQNRLLDATKDATPTDADVITINGVQFRKAPNVVVDTGHAFSGDTYVFDSKSKVVDHWQEEANVEGSYGAFSGGFKESFQSSSESETEQYYCLHEARSLVYSLEFKNPAISMVLQEVQNDQDFATLQSLLNKKEHINDTNRSTYFKFFYKYGTHIITAVQMGGYLNYYASVANSYSKSTQDIAAQVQAEYEALFKASGSGAWSNVSEQWMSSRSAKIMGYGGNPASKLVSDIFSNWNKTSDFSADFSDWVSSIPRYPSPVGFSLYPVASLFAGEQGAMMQEAYLAYANGLLSVRISRPPATSAVGISVSWQGQAHPVPQPGTGHPYGAFWMLIDRADGKLQLVPQPTITQNGFTREDLSKVPDELNNLPLGAKLVLFCVQLNPVNNPPTGDLLTFLINCGAGETLDYALAMSNAGGTEFDYTEGYYCLLGQNGAGRDTGAEVETLTQVATILNWEVPIIPEWNGQNVLYTVFDW
jgi:hypothetical protein